MTPRTTLAVIVGVALATSALTWGLAASLESPSERAALTEAPEPGPVAVPVVQRDVTPGLVTRATITFEDAIGLAAEAPPGAESAVLTRAAPPVGDEVSGGDAVFAVAGRPLIALSGRLPMWRSLVGGDSGPDVDQLQAALVDLGRLATASGSYDAPTANAVAAIWRAAGFTAPEPPTGAPEAVDAARESLRQAERTYADIGSSTGVSKSQRLQADAAVAAAEDELELTRLQAEQLLAPLRETATLAQELAADLADEVMRAELAVKAAEEADPPTPPDELDQLRNELAIARDASAVAGDEAETASETFRIAEVEQEAAVERSQEQLAIARAERQALIGAAASDGLRDAQEAVGDARRQLTQAQLDALVPLPTNEVVFLAELPRLVQSRTGEVGQVVADRVVTLAGARLTATAPVPRAELDQVTLGQEVTLDADDEVLTATVTDIPRGGSSTTVDITLTLTGDDLDAELLAGRNLRATFSSGATRAGVLLVPLAALGSDADGRERVLVVDPDDDTDVRVVLVSAGDVDNGQVEVEPLEDGLTEGDWVVVG